MAYYWSLMTGNQDRERRWRCKHDSDTLGTTLEVKAAIVSSAGLPLLSLVVCRSFIIAFGVRGNWDASSEWLLLGFCLEGSSAQRSMTWTNQQQNEFSGTRDLIFIAAAHCGSNVETGFHTVPFMMHCGICWEHYRITILTTYWGQHNKVAVTPCCAR